MIGRGPGDPDIIRPGEKCMPLQHPGTKGHDDDH